MALTLGGITIAVNISLYGDIGEDGRLQVAALRGGSTEVVLLAHNA